MCPNIRILAKDGPSPSRWVDENGNFAHLDGESVPPGKCRYIGYIGAPNYVQGVYQVGIDYGDDLCASQWVRPPPDELWWVPGKKGTLFMQVMPGNLNFSNTPLEHRRNLHIHKCDPGLEILARNERLLWKGGSKTFIPFKLPYPQGYQGVWMNPSLDMEDIGWEIYVNDPFTSGHVLEFCSY